MDGSFFQFFYEFNVNGELKKARLAFYPKPMATKDSIDELFDAADDALEREEDTLYEHLFNSVELLEQKGKAPTNTSHIRFDFDPNAKTHPPSHIQFGGVQEFRVSAEFFPLPLAFIQICQPMLPAIEKEIGDLVFERRNIFEVERPNLSIILTS